MRKLVSGRFEAEAWLLLTRSQIQRCDQGRLCLPGPTASGCWGTRQSITPTRVRGFKLHQQQSITHHALRRHVLRCDLIHRQRVVGGVTQDINLQEQKVHSGVCGRCRGMLAHGLIQEAPFDDLKQVWVCMRVAKQTSGYEKIPQPGMNVRSS